MTESTTPVPTPDPTTIAGGFQAGLNEGLNPPAKPASAPVAAAPASGVASTANDIASQTVDAAKKGANAIAKAAENPSETLDKAEKAGKGFFDNLDIGKILGGVLGLGGAWLLGNFFGDGIISTILTVCLAFPLMMIGSDKLGSTINGWMGHKQPEQQNGVTPQLSGPQQQQQKPVASPAPGQKPALALSDEELNSLFDASHHRVILASNGNGSENSLYLRAVADTEAQLPGTLDQQKIKAVEAATQGSTGIGFFANSQNDFSVVGLPVPARTPSGNQR